MFDFLVCLLSGAKSIIAEEHSDRYPKNEVFGMGKIKIDALMKPIEVSCDAIHSGYLPKKIMLRS